MSDEQILAAINAAVDRVAAAKIPVPQGPVAGDDVPVVGPKVATPPVVKPVVAKPQRPATSTNGTLTYDAATGKCLLEFNFPTKAQWRQTKRKTGYITDDMVSTPVTFSDRAGQQFVVFFTPYFGNAPKGK